jgi:hypothetical protein
LINLTQNYMGGGQLCAINSARSTVRDQLCAINCVLLF